MNNGFSTGEEDSRGNSDQICCLMDDGESCRRPAGNASYSKRIQKTVAQRRLKLNIDPQVSYTFRSSLVKYIALHLIFLCKKIYFSLLNAICYFPGQAYLHL